MAHVKDFNGFLNEAQQGKQLSLHYYDLQEEMPAEFGREARLDSDQDGEEYAEDISTMLEVFDEGQRDDPPEEIGFNVFIHPTFNTEPHKIRLEWVDEENGYGTYGPYGGGNSSTIYAGVKDLERDTILDFFKKIWAEEDYWSV
jgi:hypothetical protein